MIFDTHCHLNSEELYSRLDEVLDAAYKVGVDKFLVIGWDKASSLLAVEMAHKYKNIYAAIGFLWRFAKLICLINHSFCLFLCSGSFTQ